MEQTTEEVLRKKLTEPEYEKRIESIRRFERQLTDNGYLVLVFMHIDREEQDSRMEGLLEKDDTKWRVTKLTSGRTGITENAKKFFDRYMKDTNLPSSPWYIIDAGNRKWAELQVLDTMISSIEIAMQNRLHSSPLLQNVFPLVKMPKLAEVELQGKELNEEEYHHELKQLQKHLGSCIIVYTGRECR